MASEEKETVVLMAAAEQEKALAQELIGLAYDRAEGSTSFMLTALSIAIGSVAAGAVYNDETGEQVKDMEATLQANVLRSMRATLAGIHEYTREKSN